MRAALPIAVGIALLGCKDTPSARPAPQGSAASGVASPSPTPAAPPSTAPTGPAAISAPATPRLDPEAAGSAFDLEAEDKDWAVNTERAIKAAVPELTDVDCKQQQCRATLTAASEAELVKKADQLAEETSLRGTGARNVLLTKPTTADGKLSMKIYVRYDR